MAMKNTASISVRLLLIGAFIGTPIHCMENRKAPVIVLVVGALIGFVAYQLYQSIPDISLSGSSFNILPLNQKSFFAKLSGSSKLIVTGVVSAQKIYASGNTTYSGYRLRSETAHVNLTGSSEVYLTVTKEITGYVEGSCKVYTLGNPKVKLKLTGNAEHFPIQDT
jgi:hypothetical protein